jgi:16S rRNA G1207 methylase RsmC
LAGTGKPAGRGALVVNDGFGALALPLARAGFRVTSWSDSATSWEALKRNAGANGLDEDAVTFVPAHESLHDTGEFDVVIVKVPRELDLLVHQLSGIRDALAEPALILGAGMVKHLPRSAPDLFADAFGSAQLSRAKKKARLIEVDWVRSDAEGEGEGEGAGAGAGPASVTDSSVGDAAAAFHVAGELVGGALAGRGLDVVSLPGVFSAGRLDRGTRMLMEKMPELEGDVRVVDLGCGNGILGCAAAARDPEVEVLFADRSYLAVESARATWVGAFGAGGRADRAEFRVGHSLDGVEDGWADLILNNPPFHDAQVVGDSTAWQMFVDSRRVLAPGGALYVVGNRHLGYHTHLKRVFGNCTVVASDPSFTVFRAVRD